MSSTSKLDYLKKYISADGEDSHGNKKKKEKKTRKKNREQGLIKVGLGTRIKDEDHDWRDITPDIQDVHQKWCEDGGNDDAPVIVSLEEEEEQPVIVNEGEFELSDNTMRLKDDGDDLSPPRRKEVKDSSSSRQKMERKESESDNSPPRKTRKSLSRNDTPSRRERKRGLEDDISPPRKRVTNDEKSSRKLKGAGSSMQEKEIFDDSSPPRRSSEHRRNKEGDNSPHRRRKRNDQDCTEPLRRLKAESNNPPPRRINELNSPRCRNRDADCSSPRKRNSKYGSSSQERRIKDEGVKSGIKPSHLADTRETISKSPKDHGDTSSPSHNRAGLHTGKEFEEKQKQIQNKKYGFDTAKKEDMGHKAETVYRDKRGRKLDMLNEMMRQRDIQDGKEKRKALEEYEWGTGKVQKKETEDRKQKLEAIKDAPFARFKDDPEIDKFHREKVRSFDPMYSKNFDDHTEGDYSSKKKKEKKEKKSSMEKPMYKGPPAPPNRFGIRPGYRWDGVVRGNGWEKKIMLKLNEANASLDESYKYAVASL